MLLRWINVNDVDSRSQQGHVPIRFVYLQKFEKQGRPTKYIAWINLKNVEQNNSSNLNN